LKYTLEIDKKRGHPPIDSKAAVSNVLDSADLHRRIQIDREIPTGKTQQGTLPCRNFPVKELCRQT
jgi:hypothetical protein